MTTISQLVRKGRETRIKRAKTPALKGALGFDAVLGTNFGPRSPGTVLTLLYRLAAEAAAGTKSRPYAGSSSSRCPLP